MFTKLKEETRTYVYLLYTEDAHGRPASCPGGECMSERLLIGGPHATAACWDDSPTQLVDTTHAWLTCHTRPTGILIDIVFRTGRATCSGLRRVTRSQVVSALRYNIMTVSLPQYLMLRTDEKQILLIKVKTLIIIIMHDKFSQP